MKPTNKQKQALRELVDFKCESCGKAEEEVGTLQIHRIHRGYKGGKYVPRNIQVICKHCHDCIHGDEF